MKPGPRTSSRDLGDPGAGRPGHSYWNPYLGGVALGLLLLLVFLVTGRGLGASGAFSALTAVGVETLAPEHARSNPVHSAYLAGERRTPLADWLVLEILGVLLGAFLSARLAGRTGFRIERGPRIGAAQRLAFAMAGGLLMGLAARLARGCTSGLILSGGAVLGAGAWLFMLSVFLGGYALAWFVRRQWS